MSSKSTTLVIASLVVIAAIAFFSYRNSNTPNGEEVTGAIGTVDKYRSEQISSSDVVLEGFDPADSDKVIEAWLGDNATIDELADLLGRQTSQFERAMFLRYASAATQAELLGRSSVEDMGRYFQHLTATERVVSFGRVAQERQIAALAKQNLTLERYNQMDLQQKSMTIAKMPLEMKALTVERLTQGERVAAIGRFSEAERAELVGRASHEQYREMLGRSPVPTQASIFERASYQKQSNILERSSDVTKAAVFERTNLDGKMALLRYANTEEMDAIFGRMDEIGKVTVLGRASYDELNRMFGRLSQTERTAALEQARVSAADFERMDQQGKMAALGRVNTETKMLMLRTASVAEKKALLGRASEQELGRVFFGRTTVTERAAWIDRAPDNERAFVAKSAVTNQRVFYGRQFEQLGRQIDMQRQNQDLNERMRQTDAGRTVQTENN